jgi:hypothetical protein
MKAKLLMETIMNRKTISKESLNSSEIKNYKLNKIERVVEDFKRNNLNLIEDKEEVIIKKEGNLDKEEEDVEEEEEMLHMNDHTIIVHYHHYHHHHHHHHYHRNDRYHRYHPYRDTRK